VMLITGVEFPLLLEIALEALNETSEITLDQKSHLAATFLSSLDSFSLFLSSSSARQSPSSLILLTQDHISKLCSLLNVFSKAIPPPSDPLSSTLTSLATTCLSFLDFADDLVKEMAWNALSLLMKIDFDVIFAQMDQLNPRIPNATLEFMKTLSTTNFKLR